METQKSKVVVLAIVIFITIGVFVWMFLKQLSKPDLKTETATSKQLQESTTDVLKIGKTTRNLYSVDTSQRAVTCVTDHGYEIKPLANSDPATFQVLGEFNTVSHKDTYPAVLAKDKNQVYLDCYILEGVDPSSVSIINGPAGVIMPDLKATTTELTPYIQDVHGIYYFGERIPNANLKYRDASGTKITKQPFTTDVQNFVVLGNNYAKDSTSIFYAGKKMEGVDYATFNVGYQFSFEYYADSSDAREHYSMGKKESEHACSENEKEMPLATELTTGKIIFIKDVTYSIGPSMNGGNCLDVLGSVDREIAPPDRTNQTTFDMMTKKAGLTVVDLPPRTKQFTVERILEITDEAAFSDGGPSPWLVLSDETGVRYKMPIIFFGENGAPNDDQIIAVLQYDSKEYPLTNDSFEHYDGQASKDIYGFQLSGEGVDISTPLLSYEEAVAKVKKDYGVDPIYQGGGKVWFKKPNSKGERECGILALYDINTRRYHDSEVPDCSTIDISKTQPLYVEYCAGTRYSCLFGEDSLRATNLNTKRLVELFDIEIPTQYQTLTKECRSLGQNGRSCTADISLVDDSKLRIGIYRKNEQGYLSGDSYKNVKLRDEYIDLKMFTQKSEK